MTCPSCGVIDALHTVARRSIPLFQNIVYPSAEAARAAPAGAFTLATCRRCGFSWNAAFEPARVVYDQRYDNHVESLHIRAYYRSLARSLIERFNLVDGTVYDIGCGKGEFLRELATLAPGVHCVGVDPSCEPTREANFELICSRFSHDIFAGDARLVVLRHVLEHIATPLDFLIALHDAMPPVPLYVEVPDLDWILEGGAFWDFCYEHCNYFTRHSLADMLARAGFGIIEHRLAFGDQYQWALALPGRTKQPVTADAGAIAAVTRYATAETNAITAVQRQADSNGGLVLWGMATKGVLLSVLLGGDRIVAGIDMNPAKQGRFAAGSGVPIHPSAWLDQLPPKTQIMVMNPQYLTEIRRIAAAIRTDLSVHDLDLGR